MHPTEQLKSLEEAVERFRACILLLPEAVFLTPMDGWAPRDVLAHLIGWNRHTIDGCRDILDGRKPKYLTDAANDFSNVNAESVQRYSSDDKDALLAELDKSFGELRDYMRSVDPKQWEAHGGVTHAEWVIAAPDSVDALRDDYDAHRSEIERWSSALGSKV
jgi:hypothetical protein